MKPGSLLVDVHRGSAEPPFVMIHPVGGTVFFARRFADLLPGDPSMIGLEARGLDGRSEPHTTIEAMAEHYVALLRGRQPSGPYLLGGPSLGGIIAYEMAQRLLALGEEIGLLALFDTWGPGFPPRKPVLSRAREYAGLFAAAPGAGGKAELVASEIGKRIAPARAEKQRLDHDLAAAEPGLGLALRRVHDALLAAGNAYRFAPYPGRIVLFRATTVQDDWVGRSFADETNGFGALARGGVEVIHVPGRHQTIFDEPAVHGLAAAFGPVLARAQEEARGKR